jgi:DNA-binding response OmpR family regulator
MAQVLVVDDERRVQHLLARLLVADGHQVETASDGVEALDRLSLDPGPALVLLDLAMPSCSGMEVLRTLSTKEHCPPVIVLSAATQVATRVSALEIGASDFIMKPFHPAELMARVRRHLTREPETREPESGRYLMAGGISVDLDRRRARHADTDVLLSELEVGLLAHLMRRQGSVCRRDELLSDVWGIEFDPSSNLVDVCMRRLRNKLREAPIETVRGLGYCLAGD